MRSVFSCEFEFKSHWSSATVYSGSNELKIAFNLNFKNEGEEGGWLSLSTHQGPTLFNYFLLLSCILPGWGPETQDVLQGKEHRWIPAQSEFKNKLLIVRIKANLTSTHTQNAECDPPREQIYLFQTQMGLLFFFFLLYSGGDKGIGVFPGKL